uniref:TPR_REGION domain-containing protein n=2 Tax=Macrostomum lignano TaxID=282301 RepID=A0A1I8GUX5_9PLAT
ISAWPQNSSSANSSIQFAWKRKSDSSQTTLSSTVRSGLSDRKNVFDRLDNNDDCSLLPLTTIKRPRTCVTETNKRSIAQKRQLLIDAGSASAESGDWASALVSFRKALSLDSVETSDQSQQRARLLEMAAQAHLALGEFCAGAGLATEAVSLAPNWAPARQTLGRCQVSAGLTRQALKSFAYACFLDPTEPDIWHKDLLWTWDLCRAENQGHKGGEDHGETRGKIP